jgi:hypothetical protein
MLPVSIDFSHEGLDCAIGPGDASAPIAHPDDRGDHDRVA